MAELFDRLYGIAIIILIVVVVVAIVAAIGLFFYNKTKQKRRKTIDNIDYSVFNRKDSKDYIKDIVDIKDDMIILDNGYRFAAAIECQGFDFYSAHIAEQANTVQNYLGFINTITKPITYRQYSVSVDMEDTINMYKEAYEKVCDKLKKTNNKIDEMQAALKNEKNMLESRKKLYLQGIEDAKRELSAYEFRKFHLENQINYINENSGVTTAPLVTSTYVFDWEYNPMEFSVDLTEDEIFNRAKAELDSIVNAKTHALSMAGVRAKRCRTGELIDMCRRQSQPISAERFKLRDILGSTYFNDITTTDCIERVKTYARETVEKEAQDALMDAFKNKEMNSKDNELFISAGNMVGGE